MVLEKRLKDKCAYIYSYLLCSLTQFHFLLVVFRKQSRNMLAFDPIIHFAIYLHGDSPTLHGREPVAHAAVAAVGRGLGRVRLRQICPHGCRFLWLYTWGKNTTPGKHHIFAQNKDTVA